MSTSLASNGSNPPLLQMQGLEKRYGGVEALAGAGLLIEDAGVVHALVGENGSGKSTLLGILAGHVHPDAGAIRIGGFPCTFRSPFDAVSRGIAMVSQEVAVAPDLSVAENVLLGHRLVRDRSGVSIRRSEVRAREILEGLGLDYDPAAEVGELRPDQQQMIEIARAVSMDARILILDEPTSSLTDKEVAGLFRTIGELKAKGVSILFVSHRLDDLFAIADEVTVLRDGRTVCQAPMSALNSESLVDEMVGEAVPRAPRRRATGGDSSGLGTALAVRGLSVPEILDDVSFEVEAGEIVGLAGLAGSGRTELLETLFGLRHPQGTVELGGQRFEPIGPRAAIAAGIGYVPPDRKTQALNLAMSVSDNLTAVQNLRRRRLAMPRRGSERRAASRAADAMGVKAASLASPV